MSILKYVNIKYMYIILCMFILDKHTLYINMSYMIIQYINITNMVNLIILIYRIQYLIYINMI